jgi:aryl-alcohol dehydrogenase-like predicted oxidoreductase
MDEAVTAGIPGAKNATQAMANAAASDLPPLPTATMAAIRDFYQRRIAPWVHHRW